MAVVAVPEEFSSPEVVVFAVVGLFQTVPVSKLGPRPVYGPASGKPVPVLSADKLTLMAGRSPPCPLGASVKTPPERVSVLACVLLPRLAPLSRKRGAHR